MPRPRSVLAALALFLGPSAFAAEPELTPERLAAIQHDEEKALARIQKEHGDKQPAQMSSDERREVIREEQAAKREVLAKHEVDAKAYVVRSSKLSREEQAQVAQARQALEEKDEAEAREQAAKAPPPPEPPANQEVIIRKGLGEEDPVDVLDSDDFDSAPDDAAAQDEAAEAAAAEAAAKASAHSAKGKGASAGKSGKKSRSR